MLVTGLTRIFLRNGIFSRRTRQLGGKSIFSILVGTKGDQRGVPVQFANQPNLWFQVVLNLLPKTGRAITTPAIRRPRRARALGG